MHSVLRRWVPAFVLMMGIFLASSRPAEEIPDFGAWDLVIKKVGHVVGFGLLALAYRYGLSAAPDGQRASGDGQPDAQTSPPASPPRTLLFAWALALLYAISDELHQSWVAGRRASAIDVFLFDGLGAAAALAAYALRRHSR